MYAILDIETTGGKYNEEGITEIAIHKFDGHKVVDQFISLVNPEKEIQPFVVNLTKIDNQMVMSAPKFYEVAKRIVEITQDAVLVAHNAQFDYRILRTEFRRLGYNFERKTLCTVDLSKRLIPEAESYSLGKLVRSLGIPVNNRHRANGDALATLKLFKLLLSKDQDKTITKTVIKEETLGELSPRQLDIVKQLPSDTGVYYMHNKEGDIIYLGKSTNIKKSVNRHFTNDGKKARKIQKETKKVTYETTGSELVAILKENGELRRNRPKYNPVQKGKSFSHAIYTATDHEGYRALFVSSLKKDSNALATFNSMVGTKNFLLQITEEYQLCHKINGISDKTDNCSHFYNGKCNGTCNLKEPPFSYNQRVEDALDKYSFANKNLLLLDKGREIGEHSAVLIKNGKLKGYGFYDLNNQINNLAILESIIVPMEGDADTIHIILTYLRKNKALKIMELQPEKL
ncbi:GIY-YIG nuclease family protein [Flavobacteriaceae bacterium F89]|uniref:GIY-YIG nuclease family protein n=1 Tax=Cerina litoralis TaxID=2874477 RepID=A0AAE3EU39_9FLAO|nr:exonuclease domain-containing protein [Cerina litoralis]MCG2461112.1 GIY-YIG nuclease family protein [Cerina litoralis]